MAFLSLKENLHIPRILGMLLFLQQVDSLILNTSLPQIALSLGTHVFTMRLAITAYLLTLAVFIPVSGFVADRRGTRSTLSMALMAFLIGSLVCGAAFNLLTLVIGRLIQGVGAAFLTPVGRMVLLRSFGHPEFSRAFGLYMMLGQLGMMAGPILGGLITEYLHWRFIFLVNVPIILVVFYLTRKYLPDYHDRDNVGPLDQIGFVWFGIASGLISFGLGWLTEAEFKGVWPWASLMTGSLLMSGVVVYFLRYAKHPLLNLHLFSIRTFAVSVWSGMGFRLCIGGTSLLMSLELQMVYHFNALHTGLLLLPNALGFVLGRYASEPILQRKGYRKVLVLGAIMTGQVLLGLAFTSLSWSVSFFTLNAMLLLGFFASIEFGALNTLTFADIPSSLMSRASSLSAVLQQFGLNLGVAFAAALLLSVSQCRHTPLFSSGTFGPTFAVLGILLIPVGVTFLCLRPSDGSSLLQKKPPSKL